MTKLEYWVPAIANIRHYKRKHFAADLIAGTILSIMLIPQGLAYALLAGLPAEMGLYASILPLIAYAIFGSSKTMAIGPAALIAMMSASFSSQFASPGTPEYNAIAIILAIMSGLILMSLGFLKLGFLANLLSHPVISGFVTGSAIIIAASQIKHFLGISVTGSSLLAIAEGTFAKLTMVNPISLSIGLSSLILLYLLKRYFCQLLIKAGFSSNNAMLLSKTGPILIIILFTLISYFYTLAAKGLALVGTVPSGLPLLSIPDMSFSLISNLLPAAAILGLVSFIESISISQAFATRKRQKIDSNNELVGLGSANIISGLSGGLAVAGSFSRSAINDEAGAKTQLAGIVSAGFVLLTLYFLTDLFFFMPKAVLAATIFLAVFSLIDFKAIIHTWHYSKHDGIAMLGTLIIVLCFGVETGILAGVCLSILLFLWHTSHPHIAIVGNLQGTEHYRNVDRYDVLVEPNILTLRIDENLFFANCRTLEESVTKLISERPDVKHLVLMCNAVNMIDISALESLETMMQRLKSANIQLHFSEIKGPVMDKLKETHLISSLTGEVYLTQHQAIEGIKNKTRNEKT